MIRAVTHDAQRDVARSTFLPPAVPDQAVARPQLVQRLESAVDKKLVLVVAPPGYGKSVLLGQWATSHPSRRVAWTTGDVADDANRFARELCAALSLADGRPRYDFVDRVEAGGRRMGQAFISALLASMDKMSPVVLVLDDFHMIKNPDLLSEVASLIEQSPQQLHFLIASRANPAFPNHWLRLGDQLVELRQRDLMFAAADARQLVQTMTGHKLTEVQNDALLARTEGWVTGLQLAALSLRHVDPAEFIDTFVAGDRYVAEYLTEQVVDLQPPSVRRFLFETSVLDRLNASLCNAVTGRDDAQEMLDRLDDQSLFVSRLDTRREWFRYHPLFRTLLIERLKDSGETSEYELLHRAAQWYFGCNDIERALDCLLAANAWSDVLQAIQTFGHQLHREGRTAAIMRWVDALPTDVGRSRNEVALLRSAVHMMAGDTIVADAILHDISTSGSPTKGELLVADAMQTWAVNARSNADRVISAATSVLNQMDSVDRAEVPNVLGLTTHEALRAVALLNLGTAQNFVGLGRESHESLRAAAAANPGLPEVDVVAFGQQALIDAWNGSLKSSRRHANRSLSAAVQSEASGRPMTLSAYLALAHVARCADDLDEAAEFLDAAEIRLAPTKPCALLGIWATEKALLALAKGDPAKGLSILAQHEAAGGPPPPPAITARLRAAEARLRLVAGDVEDSARLLASVEPRVPEVVGILVRIAIERGDLASARSLLNESAHLSDGNVAIEQRLWSCIIDDLESDKNTVSDEFVSVVSEAKDEGNVRALLEADHHAMRLLRRMYIASPTPFLRRIIDAPVVSARLAQKSSVELIEQLSDRERTVLGYLPSRLSNAEIAEALEISVNTLKTHLKHIYRKLGADGRRDAIASAERLHLL